jgi:hypothetical protein
MGGGDSVSVPDPVAQRTAQFNSMTFDDNRKIVISGAMRTWETGGGRNEAKGMAGFVSLALERILNETWSIVIYDKFTEETGYGYYFHYENKWWVYGVPTLWTWTCCDEEDILKLLKDGFGWGSVTDIRGLKTAVEKAITGKFGERWRVHIAKLPPGSSPDWSIWGEYWEHDGHHFWVMRRYTY